jgi:hypothetical protein
MILGYKFCFRPLKAYFHLFDTLMYIFSSTIQNFRSMDTSHELTDFGLCGFLGYEGLFSLQMFFFAPCKIPDTTILILGPKFRFWALGAYFFIKLPID